ncbi:uncharacterized protein BDW47DRAFT_107609 [Aspergillus candidus]|uniref:Uncharacterized protein n=1 Tax=Aspergillus candidus TaxID=41067 RepID=A0A2I2F8N0_ASPCN|nr:hypothetical protein BDW47DRAFT_107609 [Aspergillus candidus]PLB36977.1 hypothetical protein BDW47DRAFT_107609 [Aspergillus candidus]
MKPTLNPSYIRTTVRLLAYPILGNLINDDSLSILLRSALTYLPIPMTIIAAAAIPEPPPVY